VLIVADPKDEVFAQPTTGVHPATVVTEVVLHDVFEPQELFVLKCA
jgi:hypothetical protein